MQLQVSGETSKTMNRSLQIVKTISRRRILIQKNPSPAAVIQEKLSSRTMSTVREANLARDESAVLHSSEEPGIKPWPKPVVISNGDYRAEAFLEKHIGGPLYANQHALPLLPIPTIHESLERLLPTVLPLARNEQEKKTC